ncbi:hypothetical protein, partial [Bordetella trematum]|uniref:hypothetical protein n=1 Tax=Bordetella trematum TaxID=123899 RepID=UPI001EE68265
MIALRVSGLLAARRRVGSFPLADDSRRDVESGAQTLRLAAIRVCEDRPLYPCVLAHPAQRQ